jgi:hypothetical protein
MRKLEGFVHGLPAMSPRKLARVALILAGFMSLGLEGGPKPAAQPALRQATPQDVRETRTPSDHRRPCQNTNHAPCR